MRTDVKLGLAVGSILFSVVLVYVLFFASGARPKTPGAPNETAAKTPDATSPVSSGSSAPATPVSAATAAPEPVVSITPTTQPSSTVAPAASSLNIYTPAGTPGAPPVASAAPADTAATSAPASGRNWQALLDGGSNGELLARSETPMVGGVRGRSSDAAPAAADSTMVPPPPVAGGMGAPATPAMDLTPSTQPAMQKHLVKPGETLWSIARDVYGNAAYHTAIAKANPKVNPSRLQAGTPLLLPDKSTLAPIATPVATAAAPTTQPTDPAKQYRVKANDNLNTICKRLYGNASIARVNQLYQLNKDRIGPNPSNLKLGMVLLLPEAPTSGNTTTGGNAASTAGTPGTPAAIPAANPLAGTMN